MVLSLILIEYTLLYIWPNFSKWQYMEYLNYIFGKNCQELVKNYLTWKTKADL